MHHWNRPCPLPNGVRTPAPAAALVGSLVLGGGYVLSRAAVPAPAKAAAVVAMLLGAALAGVFYRGGVVDFQADDRPEVQQPAAAG